MKKKIWTVLIIGLFLISCGKKSVEPSIISPVLPTIEIGKPQRIQHAIGYYDLNVSGDVIDTNADGTKNTNHEYFSSPVIKLNVGITNSSGKKIKTTTTSIIGFTSFGTSFDKEFSDEIFKATNIVQKDIDVNGKTSLDVNLVLWPVISKNITNFSELMNKVSNFDYSSYELNKGAYDILKNSIGSINWMRFYDTRSIALLKSTKVKFIFEYEDGTKGEVVKTITYDSSILRLLEVYDKNTKKLQKILSEFVNQNTTYIPLYNEENYELNGNFNGENVYLMFTDSDVNKERFFDSERIVVKGDLPVLNKNMINLNQNKFEPKIKDIGPSLDKYLDGVEKNRTNLLPNAKMSRATLIKTTVLDEERKFNVNVDEKKVVVDAKVLAINSDSTRQVNIWVDKTVNITKERAQQMADKFLKEGTQDIYEYVTNIFGKEYVEKGVDPAKSIFGGKLIAGSGEIDILLTKLNSSYSGPTTIGYFWKIDTIIPNGTTSKAINDFSNQRNIFYIDSNWFSDTKHDGTVFSTLAHEFVHMINWYQRDVILGVNTESWYNEMLAMIGEDLIDDKISVDGSKSRAEEYIYNNYLDINDKDGSYDYLDYSTGALYGAYLTRKYSNANLSFVKKLMNNPKSKGTEAVEFAIQSVNGKEKFLDTVKNFGRESLLSNDASNSSLRKSFSVVENGITYNFEEINLFDKALVGNTSFIFMGLNNSSAPLLQGGANMFYDLGNGSLITGNKKFTFNIPEGVNFEVVVKNADGTYNKTKSAELQKMTKPILK